MTIGHSSAWRLAIVEPDGRAIEEFAPTPFIVLVDGVGGVLRGIPRL